MKVKLVVIGKTEEAWLKSAIRIYEARIKHYLPFVIEEIPTPKNSASLSQDELKLRESELICKQTGSGDSLVLLDEKGVEMSSSEFAIFLNKQFSTRNKNLVFVVGGPFGFDPDLKKKSRFILSLSKMTFSHQMVRLFFTEQLYRALTILRGESYHHE